MGFLKGMKREMVLFFIIIALVSLALGLSDSVFSNYFKDAYNVDSIQRGEIEFPRELPGLICILIIGIGASLGDLRLAVIAQAISTVGLTLMGFLTPHFSLMLLFLFLFSFGQHMYMPLQDGIGTSLAEPEQMGRRMGQFNSWRTAFSLIASMLVFIGFRVGFFSFQTPIKSIFLIAAVIFLVVTVLFAVLGKVVGHPVFAVKKPKFIFRKEYGLYYLMAVLNGTKKQIMIVFGPWVLIELLNKKADTLALLGMLGAFIGIFFINMLGKWLDRYGTKRMLYIEALAYIFVYTFYGLLSGGFANGTLLKDGWPIMVTFIIFILDRMTMQMSMVRVVYLKSIALSQDEMTATLSTGISMDHVASIICAYLGGLAWDFWGPQYVFFIAAGLSLLNVWAAKKVVEKRPGLQAGQKTEAI